MSKRTKRRIRRIVRSVKKHLLALWCLSMIAFAVMGVLRLIYESGMLLILDMMLGAMFG